MAGRRTINRRRFGRYMLACGGALAAEGAGVGIAAPASPAEPRQVFAHYMVCCPIAGHEGTVAAFADEIRQARAHGVDGFVLNCGSWQEEPYYRAIATRMFEAAMSLGTDFKLFFSADGLPEADTIAMVSAFYDHPNIFRHGGKPVLSTFGGDAEWGRTVLAALTTAGKPMTFVPFFYPKIGGERFWELAVSQLIADNSYVDGFFYFGAAGEGEMIARKSLSIGQAWRRAGKLYMAPVTPYYRGSGPENYRAFETHGFEGMARQWEAAIAADAQWVEIVTWNDWGESTYVASFGPPTATELWDGHWGPLVSHEAYLLASEYYIRWFKTGAQRIERDDLYWFYRLAPRTEPGRSQPDREQISFPSGVDALEDRVFVTAFLVEPARVLIESGERRYEFSLDAGIHHVRADFWLGPQRFSVARGARTILVGEGAFPIESDNWSNFNYVSGQARAF